MKRLYKDTRERIEALTAEYEAKLCIPHIKVHHVFVDGCADDPFVIAATEGYWQYLSFTITWYLQRASTLTHNELREAWFHEYVHVMNNPLEALIDTDWKESEQFEYSTQVLARALSQIAGK